jgi:hypothetical protein
MEITYMSPKDDDVDGDGGTGDNGRESTPLLVFVVIVVGVARDVTAT